MAEIDKQFRTMPMEARRLTGPLFWLHGNESKQRLEEILEKVAEGHNGCFCAESRPHSDWLGPRWYADLDVCLQAAKRLDLKMWIFDERWWPSQTVAGKVPPEYRAKRLVASATDVEGPGTFEETGYGDQSFVATVAGQYIEGGIDGESLTDLAPYIRHGKLTWQVPEGKWKVLKFTWVMAPKARQGGHFTVDGASKDCVDWFIKTVYQPHYDRFKAEHGKTIVGYFYDEPETQGDWGTELQGIFEERKADWKKALVAHKFQLAGDGQAAAKYAYLDAFFEAWGRTMYGGMSTWCEDRGCVSIGHFMEHDGLYLDHGVGAGNLFQMQKYNAMGGMDLVVRQLYPGQRRSLYQVPKLTSSISHVYDKADHLAMCEIFGAYGQDLTYAQMKWLVDHHQVRGVNFMITHSFNPKAPNDTDCPPYFYNGGFEPRWPLYRVWADYTNRLSLLLSGGRHVCPVAFLFCGNSKYVGRTVTPEDMTSALQDALFDCDWLPYDVFEEDTRVADRQLYLHHERYRILIVPPVEVIPYATLRKVKKFFDAGGVVAGYGFLPSKSATIGRSSSEILALCDAIWGEPKPGPHVCKTNATGGRSYLLAEKPSPQEIQQAFVADAGIHPTLEVLEGETDNWLHVLHRVKEGCDVFFICNQNHTGEARRFRFRATAAGVPEYWDAMRNEITSLPYTRTGNTVEFDLTMTPNESVLIVFQPKDRGRKLPSRIEASVKPAMQRIPIVSDDVTHPVAVDLNLDGCHWVWCGENDPMQAKPGAQCFCRRLLTIPEGRKIRQARLLISADNEFVLYVNRTMAGTSDGKPDSWRRPQAIAVTDLLTTGTNVFAATAVNGGEQPNPAGLIGKLVVEFDQGPPLVRRIDKTWKVFEKEQPGWLRLDFDDRSWPGAREYAKASNPPWHLHAGLAGPVSRTFMGRCHIPQGLNLARYRVYVEMDGLIRPAASVTVNGAYAGGMIGGPFRLNVSPHVKRGENTIEIAPYAPESASLALYPADKRQTQ